MRRPRLDQVIVAILLLGALGLAPAIAMAHGRTSQGTYVTTDPVDVKAGPNEGYETVRTFRKGTTFEIVGAEGSWLKVSLAEHESRFGYIDKRFAVVKDQHVRINARSPNPALTKGQTTRINPRPAIPGTYFTTKPINARLGPGEEYSIISTIPKGTKIVIVGMEGEWLRIASKRGDPPAYVKRRTTFVEPAD